MTRRGDPDPSAPPFETTGTVLLIGLSLQIAASGVTLMFLPWLLKGRVHLNGVLPPLLLVRPFSSSSLRVWVDGIEGRLTKQQIGWLGGFIAASTGSAWALGQTHTAISTRAPITYSPVWIALLWSSQACLLIAAALEHVERNFERFTDEGDKIDREGLDTRGTRVWN